MAPWETQQHEQLLKKLRIDTSSSTSSPLRSRDTSPSRRHHVYSHHPSHSTGEHLLSTSWHSGFETSNFVGDHHPEHRILHGHQRSQGFDPRVGDEAVGKENEEEIAVRDEPETSIVEEEETVEISQEPKGVPIPSAEGGRGGGVGVAGQVGARATSITFNPTVTLDSGHERGLEEPVVRSEKLKSFARPRGRSLLQELANSHTPPSPPRSGRAKYGSLEEDQSAGRLGRRPPGPSLLRSSLDGLANEGRCADPECVSSLTSASTTSPNDDEAVTPPETPVEFFRSTSYTDTPSIWPVPLPRATLPRSKSYQIDPRRPSRRSSSRYSPSSLSPASAFLSSWGSVGAAATCDPDDEGQEVGNWILGKQIGVGGFSVVREARTIEDGHEHKRAVKIVRRHIAKKADTENEQIQAEFEHEVSLWRHLDHRNILPLLAVYNHPFATFCFTQLHKTGSLFDLIRKNRQGLPMELAKRYSFQLASALRYLHEDAHVVHRDIKLENCLLDMSNPVTAAIGGNVLLCDFGMAEYTTSGQDVVDDDDDDDDGEVIVVNEDDEANTPHSPRLRSPKTLGPSDTSTSFSVVGSLEYASPELLASSVPLCSKPVDMWAFGVVSYALLLGALPFQHKFPPKLRSLIQMGEWNHHALHANIELEAGHVGHYAGAVVRGCLDPDPVLRWNVGHVLSSLWLEDCQRPLYDEELSQTWNC